MAHRQPSRQAGPDSLDLHVPTAAEAADLQQVSVSDQVGDDRWLRSSSRASISLRLVGSAGHQIPVLCSSAFAPSFGPFKGRLRLSAHPDARERAAGR